MSRPELRLKSWPSAVALPFPSPAPEQVTESARRDDTGRHREAEAGNDPLHGSVARVKIALDVRYCHIHDEDVER
jgi:hypothetical protein